MVLRNMDGWRRLGTDNVILKLHSAHAGWRKATPAGDIYVFEYCLQGSPYRRRYSMVLYIASAPAESRIVVDLPRGKEANVLNGMVELLASTGTILNMALKGIMPEVAHD